MSIGFLTSFGIERISYSLKIRENYLTCINIIKDMSKKALLGPEIYQKKESHEFWCLQLKICGNDGPIQVVWAIMAQPHVK